MHRQSGLPPLKAAVEGACEVGMPVTAAVLTTHCDFFAPGLCGRRHGKIHRYPARGGHRLSDHILYWNASFCCLRHLSHLPDPNINHHKLSPISRAMGQIHDLTNRGMEWLVARIYAPFLSKALYWRYITFCAAVAILFLTFGLVRGGFVKFEVFPGVDGYIMTAHP